MDTLIICKEDIAKLIDIVGIDRLMLEVIDNLSSALRNFDCSKTSVHRRDGFNFQGVTTGLLEWMPMIHHNKSATLKMVSYIPSNPSEKSLPTIISNIQYYDTSSGHLKAIVDGTLLTAIRTGAASAIASQRLMHTQSRTLGLIGCGVQNVTQLHALSLTHDFDDVLIFDTQEEIMESFITRTDRFSKSVRISKLNDLVQQADVICTATSVDVHRGPVFDDVELKPHLHVNAVGSDFPGKTELPLSLLRRGKVIPDFVEQAFLEGECQQLAAEHVTDDLSSLVKGGNSFDQFRTQTTVFDSTGYALEDNVAVEVLLKYAEQHNLGTELELECIPPDPRNPYDFTS